MGLDTTYDCWHGPYGQFKYFRNDLAKAAGMPPLSLMSGFYKPGQVSGEGSDGLPLQWESLKPDILHVLLNHSDCDGSISPADALPLAHRLISLVGHPAVEEWSREIQQFADGLTRAHQDGEEVQFH